MDGHTIMKFDFPGINLLDSSHHNLCHGVFEYSVNSKSGLPDGTRIPNRAGIFFDYNPVVLTNSVENIIGTPKLGVIGTSMSKVSLFPNPAGDELTIQLEKSNYNSFTISTATGQLVMQKAISNTITKVDIKALPAGLYLVELRGENGTKIEKMVKL